MTDQELERFSKALQQAAGLAAIAINEMADQIGRAVQELKVSGDLLRELKEELGDNGLS